jgi:hypothetical protein
MSPLSPRPPLSLRPRPLLGLVLVAPWLLGCAGTGPGWPSSDGSAADRGNAGGDGSRADGARIDARASDAAVRDATARDGGVRDLVATDKGPCSFWQNWSCDPDESLRCIASCDQITPTRVMSCNASGDCICGAGVEPCGQFPLGDQPCDTCRNALEGACCHDL